MRVSSAYQDRALVAEQGFLFLLCVLDEAFVVLPSPGTRAARLW